MLSFLAGEPNLARLCMVEALVAGPVVVDRYDAAIQDLVPYFEAGREGKSKEVLDRLSPTTEEALVGGMVSLISRRIIAGRTAELEELLPDLVEFTLTPYLGSTRGGQDRPREVSSGVQEGPGDPLKTLQKRAQRASFRGSPGPPRRP